MYNKLLDTFLTVANCGSFSKAAEQLHISSPAVVKQINQLEDETEVRLFQRNPRGVILTETGKAFQVEARRLIRSSEEALQRVRHVEARSIQQIRLGTALLRPAGYFLHLWSQVYGKSLEHRVNIVPFLDNSYEGYLDTVAGLGRNIDVIAGPFAPELAGHRCNALIITRLPFCCAIPSGHHLVNKPLLNVSDLRGETVIILHPGQSSAVDEARAELLKYPDITLADVADYEPSTFNHCESTNQLLLTLDCWRDAHPMLKTVPINWSCGGPYGLLYPLEPSQDVQNFIDYIRRSLKNGKR